VLVAGTEKVWLVLVATKFVAGCQDWAAVTKGF
jgi:hypothetical protein